jgi:hypothetical protein
MCFFGFWYRVTVFSVGLVETSVVGRVGVSSSSAPLGSVCFSLFYAHTLHSRGLDAPLTIRPRGGGDSQKAKIGYSYQVQPLGWGGVKALKRTLLARGDTNQTTTSHARGRARSAFPIHPTQKKRNYSNGVHVTVS